MSQWPVFGDPFYSIETLDMRRIVNEQAQKLAPDVRSALSSSYGAAGVGIDTGRLSAAVSSASVKVTPTSLLVTFAAGQTKDKHGLVYIYGNAINSGAVHNSGGGAKYRKAIKRSGVAPAGVRITPAKEFFKLNDAQVKQFSEKLTQLVQTEVNQKVKAKP